MLKRTLLTTVLGLCLSLGAIAQSAQLRVNVVQNDATTGGNVVVNLELKTTDVAPANTLGSATIDLNYNELHLTPVDASEGVVVAGDGYLVSVDPLDDDATAGVGEYIRLSITSANIGTGIGKKPGHKIPDTYEVVYSYTFQILAAGQASPLTDLTVREGSLSVGFYENDTNNPATGVINEVPVTVDNATDISLPVELMTFTATAQAGAIELAWATASESNNAGFEVERSLEGTRFSKIGYIEGAGTSTSARTYGFVDRDMLPNVAKMYYRLKQVDFDGGFTVSPTLEVSAPTPKSFRVDGAYPNPFNGMTQIAYDLPDQQLVRVQVFDALGRAVKTLVNEQQQGGRYSVRFDAGSLPSGMYIYQIDAGMYQASGTLLYVK